MSDPDPQKPITTVDGLHDHLVEAAAVELSTIPLYLYALYSIRAEGDWQWDAGISAQRTIRSVVIEEMLHLCLARNILTATGGDMALYDREIVPQYPGLMKQHTPDLMLRLEPCTPELMTSVFMPLEQPKVAHAPPEPDRYQTLGQFYEAIVDGLKRLDGPDLWKDARPELQYAHGYWNQDGGGSPLAVTNLATALEAITTIVEQGEGAKPGDQMTPLDPDHPVPGADEWSHYAKFSRIAQGIDPVTATGIDPKCGLWPVPTDPSVEQFEGPVRDLAVFFNAAYCYVLRLIDAYYREPHADLKPGTTNPGYGMRNTFLASMGGLLFPLADLLVRQPGANGYNAAPTFEFYEFEGGAKQDLINRCRALLPDFPSLGGDNSVLWLLGNLPDV